jgi:hypothetical protein
MNCCNNECEQGDRCPARRDTLWPLVALLAVVCVCIGLFFNLWNMA